MNKQDKGNGKRGIEWTQYSWNPIGGCKHACRWEMPDGSIAKCYAESVAEGVAQAAYPHGFEHHYWRPDALDEPLKLKAPARIFLDSMSDLMGHWIPEEQIEQVLDICRQATQHQFQLLTKNAPRLLKFADRLPNNLWVGVSMPPTFFMGKRLSEGQQRAMLNRALDVLWELDVPVRWMSFEPLSFDVTVSLRAYDMPLEWAVIGAATNGAKAYQPNPNHVASLLYFLDSARVPVFFKGNLEWDEWYEEFPVIEPTQMSLL